MYQNNYCSANDWDTIYNLEYSSNRCFIFYLNESIFTFGIVKALSVSLIRWYLRVLAIYHVLVIVIWCIFFKAKRGDFVVLRVRLTNRSTIIVRTRCIFIEYLFVRLAIVAVFILKSFILLFKTYRLIILDHLMFVIFMIKLIQVSFFHNIWINSF